MPRKLPQFVITLYPELERMESPKEQFDALVEAASRWTTVWAAALILATTVLLKTLDDAIEQGLGVSGPISNLISFSVFMALMFGCLFSLFYLFSGPIRKRLRRQLREKGHAICLGCGYDVRAHADLRCPECGTEVIAPPNKIGDSR